MLLILLVFAFLLSLIVDILIIKYSTKSGKMLDKDSINKPQKMHFGDIPRAGGIGIFTSFCAFIVLFAIFGILEMKYIALIIPAFFIFCSGILEDFHSSISPKVRLLLQSIGCICAIVIFECVITDIGFSLPFAFAVIFTLFCIVGVTNAINIIDGFNGLASGCVILMLASIAIVSFNVGNSDVFYISLIIIASILGFFILNFPKGKIFLGDGGAYLLGFLVAFLLIILTQNPPAESLIYNSPTYESASQMQSLKNAIFKTKVSAYYGLCIAIYPVFEVLFSIWRRRKRKLQAMQPDCIHLHTLIYRRITRSNCKTSMMIWAIISPFVFLPVFFYDKTAILLIFIAIFVIFYIYFYRRIARFKLSKADNPKI